MKLSRLLVAIAAVAAALAFGQGTAFAWSNMTGGDSFGYSVTLHDNTLATDFAGELCPPAAIDQPDPATNATVCGHVQFTTASVATVNATADFPADQQIDLVLCSTDMSNQNVVVPVPQRCPGAGREVACDRANPSATRVTLSCATNPGAFELVVVPNFVFTCTDTTDALTGAVTSVCPGLTVTGTVSLSGTPAQMTSYSYEGKGEGGGKVDGGRGQYSYRGDDDEQRHNQGHVKYKRKRGKDAYGNDDPGCSYRSSQITGVTVVNNPLTGGGVIDIDGLGYANGSSTATPFHVHAVDGGSTGLHTFSLTSSGCSTQDEHVSSGKNRNHKD
jgi:hypothetical protein